MLREMILLFLEQALELLPEIRGASQRGDDKDLEQSAHKLRGSLGNFGANRATKAAERLEMMGRRGESARSDRSLGDLECEVALLCEALTNFADQ